MATDLKARLIGVLVGCLTAALARDIEAGNSQAGNSAAPAPLVAAHAHNDYAHARPLLDALDHGFCSVEADIFLVDGQLLVAHTRNGVRPERTLQALYLDPLRERVRNNGGRVFPNGPEQTLLIDLKTDWKTLYPALRAVLTNYADILTTFRDGMKQTNAVLVVISGDRSREMFAGETVRYAALDGELSDLDSSASSNLIPWISHQWGRTFKWRGEGAMPADELAKLKEIVAKAHQQGRRVRFWGAPDRPEMWRLLREVGVNLINTDRLAELQTFLHTS
ncbi:MAG TPA: phosphatidylinositol-specific phospholipase C/glycerophosphodiester phosphodiesterase family protein [Verrucomicrobiae bacterium]